MIAAKWIFRVPDRLHGLLGMGMRTVKILIGLGGINPEKADNSGRTTLSLAAENGHEGVVKVLLGFEEVNPDTPDMWGKTPLLFAARNGHGGVVKILLGRK